MFTAKIQNVELLYVASPLKTENSRQVGVSRW